MQEEDDFDIDMDAPLAVAFKKRKLQTRSKRKKPPQAAAECGGEGLQASAAADAAAAAEEDSGDAPPGIAVSLFDYSVENHFKAVNTLCKLCGQTEIPDFDPPEINRLSSSIKFIREWKYFNYNSRTIRFARQNESVNGKDVIGEISLPQFSAASVPKKEAQNGEAMSPLNKDFVLYVGGPVWTLDWCPRVYQNSGCDMEMEFVAVAAHPPESSYHKIGVPLTGRGVIQIWCLLNIGNGEDLPPQIQKKQKRNSRKRQTDNPNSTKIQKPRGRPRKSPENESLPKKPRGRPRKSHLNESLDNVDNGSHYEHEDVAGDKLLLTAPKRRTLKDKAKTKGQTHANGLHLPSQDDNEDSPSVNPETSAEAQRQRGRRVKKPVKYLDYIDSSSECVQALAIEYPEDSSPPSTDVALGHVGPIDTRNDQEMANQRFAEEKLLSSALEHEARTGDQAHCHGLPIGVQDKNEEAIHVNSGKFVCRDPDSIQSSENITPTCSDTSTLRNSIPKDVALPRMMLCLAHNGKVAWDVKWQPSNSYNKHRMGYLAVLLGNGALEVWEVPFPRTVQVIYPACHVEGTDPRFMKLEPVFRCSKLKCGDRQSIPLTLEWSASSPHDMILAGCHDGVVALWKFSTSCSCKDTKPLLCFNADTVPIRALAWAPAESGSEGANVIGTAGHKGMKFWDIRDPFHPLWHFNPLQRVVYSLDWVADPRCVIVTFDDGTLRTLSLMKAAYDVPVTGKPFVGTQQQGFHSYLCSSFTIWSIHVSRQTGMVAYCGADGNTLRFQLTTRAIERDPLRNRVPHFLCGSISEEESTVTVITRESNTPFPMKKSMNEWSDAPRTKRGFLSLSNQMKRAKEQMAEIQKTVDQPLALCYGNDPGTAYDSDSSIAQKNKQGGKSKTATKTKSKSEQKALICIDENSETLHNEADEGSEIVDEVESFPPKVVAIHKVRWNMNKGSEKWLCYGGAAGIVRCQEIDISIS